MSVMLTLTRMKAANNTLTEYLDLQEKLIVELTDASADEVAKRRAEYQALQTLIETTQARIEFLTNALKGNANDRISKQESLFTRK